MVRRVGPRARAAWPVLLAAALLAGCASAPILGSAPIPVPAGVTAEQTQAAIRVAIARANVGSTGVWLVEREAPGLLVAGIRVRLHYLQVTYRLGAGTLVSSITASHNLQQDDDSINKRANVWQARLDDFVRQEMAALSLPRPR